MYKGYRCVKGGKSKMYTISVLVAIATISHFQIPYLPAYLIQECGVEKGGHERHCGWMFYEVHDPASWPVSTVVFYYTDYMSAGQGASNDGRMETSVIW